MTEQTALLLAGLSHGWLLFLLPFPVVLYGLARYAGAVTARAGLDPRVRRWAQAGRVLSSGLLGVSLVVVAVALLHVGCAVLVAHSNQCRVNMERLGTALLVYAEDHDGRLPPAARWAEEISPVLQRMPPDRIPAADPFRCPASETPGSYGLNAALAARSLYDQEEPSQTVMLFEADAPVRSFAGGPPSVARRRHSQVPNVVVADGHAKRANAYVQRTLLWAPGPPGRRL